MKTRIVFSVLMVMTAGIFYFTKPAAKENAVQQYNGVPDTQFIIGAYDNAYGTYSGLSELSFNTWHKYTDLYHGWIGISGDRYDNPPSVYGTQVHNKINDNESAGMRTIMDRPKMAYLSSGQISTYQAEQIAANSGYYWFYAYNESKNNIADSVWDIADTGIYGSGETVKYCKAKTDHSNAGFILKGLRSNREQAEWGYGDYADKNMKWYIKPRIRIDSSIVYNNPNLSICKLNVTNWNGDTIKSITIKASMFKKTGVNYNGSYLEHFYYSSADSNIIDSAGKFLNPSGHDIGDWDVASHIDYQVYWYGLCDMWIDYVKLENEPARQLFTGMWDDQLQAEVGFTNWQTNNGTPNYFFVNEFQFNQLPVMDTLNRKILSYSGNKFCIVPSLVFPLFQLHIPNCWNFDLTETELKYYLTEKTNLKLIMSGDYALEGFPVTQDPNRISYMPSTLCNTSFDDTKGILSYPTSPASYDTWLQDLLDYGKSSTKFIKHLQMSNAIYKWSGVPFINYLQCHLWWNRGAWHLLKEPSNEELAMTAYLTVSYGSRGILFYPYNSENTFNSNFYYRGIMDYENGIFTQRDSNVYNQNKYEKMKEINAKLKKWGPYLMKFDAQNVNSYIYRIDTARASLSNNSCFWQFVAFKPGSGLISCYDNLFVPAGLIPDCQYDTYLQIATFGSIEPNSEYFMVINRRCSPYVDSTSEDNRGGKRKIRAYLHPNHPAFSNFKNWNIINCENNNLIANFNKANPGYINLDWFMPGEGKLFKIKPVL